MIAQNNYEDKAILYAEKYGIIEFKVKGNEMIYYTSFPLERMTYKAVVNLDEMKEKRTPLKRYYKAYSGTIGGIQVNYRA